MSALTTSNRINIPAVCRLRHRETGATLGTAVLIGPGLLLTSTHAVPSKGEAAELVAVFFEGTKKTPIVARLEPQRVYFSASYPEYMDYCLVACEPVPVMNVGAVHVGLVEGAWPQVREGDTVLLVQHIIGEKRRLGEVEQKLFEEILRVRDDLYFLKANGTTSCAGCPAFNDEGQLVGMQVQYRSEREGVVSRVLSISAIVRHLFANTQLPHIPQDGVTFEDVWSTWFVEKDASRLLLILSNFNDRKMVRQATVRLCEMASEPATMAGVAECGGIEVLLSSFGEMVTDDADLVCRGLRALWNMSVGDAARLAQMVEGGGVLRLLPLLEHYADSEEISQYCVVLLHNVLEAGLGGSDLSEPTCRERVVLRTYAAITRFPQAAVLQKFGFTVLSHLIDQDETLPLLLVQQGVLTHINQLIDKEKKNVYLMEAVMKLMASLTQSRKAISSCAVESDSARLITTQLIDRLVGVMLAYPTQDTILINGNRALWGLGNDAELRAAILQNPDTYNIFQLSLPALLASSRRE